MPKIKNELPVDRDKPGKNFNIQEKYFIMKKEVFSWTRRLPNGRVIRAKERPFHFFVEEKGPDETGA